MTYRELIAKLSTMTDDQLDSDLTIYVEDEYYPAEMLVTDEDEGRLDPDHPYFKIKDI